MSEDQRDAYLAGIAEGDEVEFHVIGFPDLRLRTRVVRVTPTGRMKVVSGYAFGPKRVHFDTYDPSGVKMSIKNRRIHPIEGPSLLEDLRDVDIARIQTWVYICKSDRARDLCGAVLGVPEDEALEITSEIAGYRAKSRAAFPYKDKKSA